VTAVISRRRFASACRHAETSSANDADPFSSNPAGNNPTNHLLAQQKLVSHHREGSKVVKRYDTARTPVERAIDSGVLSPAEVASLRRMTRAIRPGDLSRHTAGSSCGDATSAPSWPSPGQCSLPSGTSSTIRANALSNLGPDFYERRINKEPPPATSCVSFRRLVLLQHPTRPGPHRD
jgi:hypothetical protein